MSRWRDIKQGNKETTVEEIQVENLESCANIPTRIKAFVVDMFMIMMPIMYISTYLVMGGKDDFQDSNIARWITSALFGIIVVLFWKIKGQTPGFKAYSLMLVDAKTKEKISILKAILRYIVFLFSAVTVVLAFIPFFRKDKKSLQDIAANTLVISTE